MTNTTKANLIAFVNAVLGLGIAFNIALTQAQIGAVDVALNAALSLYVVLTYKQSPKRIPDTPTPPVAVPVVKSGP